jgi:hypothetical protein
MGPFRANLSKSGIGYSMGAGGFRVGRSARGRKYSSFNIPGSGLTYRTGGTGCLVLLSLAVLFIILTWKAAWK